MQKPLSKTLCNEWSNLMNDINLSGAVDLSGLLNKPAEDKAKQLPEPKRFHVLCVVPEAMEQYADSEVGIVKSSQAMYHEEVLTSVLFVVKLGPDAYKDETRFPSGPSCKEGDFVIVRPNSGTRLKIHGREFRIINDDSVEAVVEDPRGIGRVA
jgi:co-chaperonin GroES (HSP10)